LQLNSQQLVNIATIVQCHGCQSSLLAFSSTAQDAAVSRNAQLMQHALEMTPWLACILMHVILRSEGSAFVISGEEILQL